MADTPDEAGAPEPVVDKDQMIADLRQEQQQLRQKLADSEALVGILKTPKKVKDGLKKDGSPDMRQTKGKALAAAAAADTDPPASIKYRISIRVVVGPADPLLFDPVTHEDFDGPIDAGALYKFADYENAEAPYFGPEVTKAVRDCGGTPDICVYLMKMEDGEMPEVCSCFTKSAGLRHMTGDMPQEEGIPVEGTIFSLYGT